jgi:hypothetical protein
LVKLLSLSQRILRKHALSHLCPYASTVFLV